jgi:hypothetical protein
MEPPAPIVVSRVSGTYERHQSRMRKQPVMGEITTTFVGLDAHRVSARLLG